ncbi:MAG: Tat pathway signal protein [Clostridium sp.]|nr:Tat pathway signal protein [Clostridium sp.]
MNSKVYVGLLRTVVMLVTCIAIAAACALIVYADPVQDNVQAAEGADTPLVPPEPVILASAEIPGTVISADGQSAVMYISANCQMINTDGNIYIFQLDNWEKDLSERSDYLTAYPSQPYMKYTVPLLRGTGADRTNSSFVAAVFDGTKYRIISNRSYPSGPEVLAYDRTPVTYTGKKGLTLEPGEIDEGISLGIKSAQMSMPLNMLAGYDLPFQYNGEVYYFNSGMVSAYDQAVKKLTDAGVVTTMVLLNDWSDLTPDMFRPGTVKNNSPYYAFNIDTPQGQKRLAATAAFLADRYSGLTGHGRISNWVIGNEVNDQYWNYAGSMELQPYVELFSRAFRVFYNEIRSRCAGDGVFFSLTYYWNDSANTDGLTSYKGKDFLDCFNAVVKKEGPMDWGLAYHPYPYPMSEPMFWDDGAAGLTMDLSTPILNYYNLMVLVDYMKTPELRNADGQVRRIALTEQGFSSTTPSGQKLREQAAAFAYSYYMAVSIPEIECYNLHRQVDAPQEVAAGLSYGLKYHDENKGALIVSYHAKPIYYVFRDIDKGWKKSLEVSEQCKKTLGISKWSELIPGFEWKDLE